MRRQKSVILVIASLPHSRRLMSLHLGVDYEVLTASDVPEARNVFTEAQPDLVIVDVDMPGDEGFVFCKRLRAFSDVPLIVLSSRAKESDKVTALELGVDNYLTKPFGMGEFQARVRAVLRRTEESRDIGNGKYEFDELSVDLGRRRVTSRGKEVMLTPTELALLSVFVRNAGKMLTHRYVLEEVWGSAYTEEREYLRAYVYNLRRKIEPNARVPRHILNAPGVGYQFAPAIGNQHADVLASTSSAS
ncbi:MAG: hypothetical protein A2842_01850 [Candidatus Wildermuthbacteria bacterium RIFCSPHIGHO2_01_FULL_48_25]|uniref:DNA-binding response regulator n=1 Tax=Candidatus Wildermuthbacteria bacterium RIFCSPLOWO2_01_FULL_48_16 TaxID=1802461 RepID=A0A1G2RKP5_9BACT|nr:MAG: hypothetical protein A2842_01850 [Candidatus Wildermuthbacteria bacterium RIFCSPHIGHO2_01_FULL_48_25]OHA68556.1 MAG: hypothetical protein A3J57_00185 [Candidatus Wildermuthbacteria bacterium RIFCSPHIGHO2_02_FULL_49_12b]OHA73420.1 MAG: hypothetical protein A3B24_02315 [Candidatus Wildermuthbacteria bacterium RIFCSPLOWO2_01_FULL_48_16]